MVKSVGSTGAVVVIAVISYLLSLTKDSPYLDSPGRKVAVLACSIPVIGAIGLLVVRDYIFVPLQFLPSLLIGKIAPIDDIRAKYESGPKTATVKRLSIPTPSPGVTLDGMVLRTPGLEHTPPDKVRWIIWFNANGVIYEQVLEFVEQYAAKLNANAIVFNYRGVGHSTGWPSEGQSLFEDGRAVFDHVATEYGAVAPNVLLHGHSMGGVVAAGMFGGWDVARHGAAPQCKRVNDRSFRTVVSTAQTMMRAGLGRMMGVILMSYLSSVVVRTTGQVDDRFYELLLPFNGWMPCMVAGWWFGGTEAMISLTEPVIEFMDWNLNALEHWDPAGTLTIFHRGDGVINYRGSSLHGALTENGVADKYKSFELTNQGPPQENHMYPLNKDPAEFDRVVDAVKQLWV